MREFSGKNMAFFWLDRQTFIKFQSVANVASRRLNNFIPRVENLSVKIDGSIRGSRNIYFFFFPTWFQCIYVVEYKIKIETVTGITLNVENILLSNYSIVFYSQDFIN